MWFYARIFVRPVRADLFTGILSRVVKKERPVPQVVCRKSLVARHLEQHWVIVGR